jgi:hypothetical protein
MVNTAMENTSCKEPKVAYLWIKGPRRRIHPVDADIPLPLGRGVGGSKACSFCEKLLTPFYADKRDKSQVQ